MYPVAITGLPASLCLCKTRKIPRGIVPFSILWEMLCILKEDVKGEVKVENEEEDEESIMFKILTSFIRSMGVRVGAQLERMATLHSLKPHKLAFM